jgi:hypothetical protein
MSGDLLESARQVVNRADPDLDGVWPRAAAFLARQALEDAVDRLWDQNLPGMRRASRATQLACLGYATPDRELTDGVRVAWHALSRACHHHQYELAPTAAELEMWIEKVDRLVARLDGRP